MKKLILFICFILLKSISFGQTPANDPHWQLLFEDDFNTLNTSIWKVANDFDHYGEYQVYTNRTNNVYISNSNLVLQLNKEFYTCNNLNQQACNRNLYNYTSGWVETNSSYNVQYGYIESRIKLPYGYGLWPAFWTFLGSGITNNNNADEIDIFEMVGDLPPTTMSTNIHMSYCNCQNYSCGLCNNLYEQECPNVSCNGLFVDIPNYANLYHTFAVEWSPSKIIWYVDGIAVRNFPNPGIVDPVRIILNLAVTSWKLPNSTTPFPSMMYIDYLKVYQLKADNGVQINSCTYNFNNYDNKVKKSIIIGGGNCTNSVSANISLRATDFIEIRGDFNIPSGITFYMDVNSK